MLSQNTTYLEIYHTALNNYKAQTQRTHYILSNSSKNNNLPRYSLGWLTLFRHSKQEYSSLISLRENLQKNPENSITIIQNHFGNKKNKWNNHSFSSFLRIHIGDKIDNNMIHTYNHCRK